MAANERRLALALRITEIELLPTPQFID